MQEFLGTGRLCNSPKIRKTEKGQTATFTVAFPREYQRKDAPNTDFLRCVAFDKKADFAEKYLHKGMKVEIKGELRTGSYQEEGKKISTVEIHLSYLNFGESKSANEKYQESASQSPMEEKETIYDPEQGDFGGFMGMDGLITCPECGSTIPDAVACCECGAVIK